jgi:hypothetical protein
MNDEASICAPRWCSAEHDRYVAHLGACDHCAHQRWCSERDRLDFDAAVADRMRQLSPISAAHSETASRANG